MSWRSKKFVVCKTQIKFDFTSSRNALPISKNILKSLNSNQRIRKALIEVSIANLISIGESLIRSKHKLNIKTFPFRKIIKKLFELIQLSPFLPSKINAFSESLKLMHKSFFAYKTTEFPSTN